MAGKKVAVIGAGSSGLVAIKCCLDEGLSPVCFERSADIGGLWNFRPEGKEDGQATVMKSTIINTSKEMMCWSDFPIPKEYPNYMHNTYVMKYFRLFVDKFDLTKYIKFQHEIVLIKQAPCSEETGQWEVKVKDIGQDQEHTYVFDAVLVCTGHHARKYEPTFPGQEEFQGKIIHSHDYRDHKGYEDKRVVVVGVGNSGNDVASELGRISQRVFLATRRGTWIFNRVGENGLPGDVIASRRLTRMIFSLLPFNMLCSMIESKVNARFDHEKYGLKPKHRIMSAHPSVNDDLPNRILSGGVVVKPNIRRFTKTGVEFEDGTMEDNIDAVILATGYIFGFPFIDEKVIKVEKNVADLYKYMWPLTTDHPTLAVIGYIQPLGAIFPIAELQCRWATRVFKGLCMLPSKEDMKTDILRKRHAMAKRYVPSQRHTIQVDYVPYMDELADQVGCKPDILKLFLTDPRLALEVLTGPCTPCQYRLCGPGQWAGAREAVLTTMDRVYYPLNTRKCDESRRDTGMMKLLVAMVLIIAVIFKLFF
ncbi:dimethylaniline monooxygenase [N-oxide-forming] 5 [Lingula anatina]|uniref:Flavin-containing monooxygenase n=1 Tax=Lingula anatina TaxID=7574 RepID=A0A1S3IQH8_LINAN|nr:dimethylaniline monooxygenase [N-oxide-forming] 5 [Lingula anatina]XP_013400167.1 dimethylaniline monooxygenase [N-oxide-forming] 5 [Lingula anatina]|eukprot:XP_013400166.1 dimethylaniline monooxygenase [N-oxide-forming] 5 [Lingula anatina]